MRGTDPTKSKWECPNMLYVCFWLRLQPLSLLLERGAHG